VQQPIVQQPIVQQPAAPPKQPAAQKKEPKKKEPKKKEPKKQAEPKPAEPASAPMPARPRDEAQEDRLVNAFHRVTEIIVRCKTPADAANAFVDLALELVPAEAAAVFYAHIAERDLHVAAARGPAASYALEQRVPMGAGIVGTAIDAEMGLAVQNVQNDPRYSAEVPEGLGVRPESIASVPVQKGGRTFGALHLVNRRGGTFAQDEIEVLCYLAARMAEFLERYFAIAA
jgi:GAF domain-containing protein